MDTNIISAVVRVPARDLADVQAYAAELIRHYQLDVRRWNQRHRGEEYPCFTAELVKAQPSNRRPRIRASIRELRADQLKKRFAQRRPLHFGRRL